MVANPKRKSVLQKFSTQLQSWGSKGVKSFEREFEQTSEISSTLNRPIQSENTTSRVESNASSDVQLRYVTPADYPAEVSSTTAPREGHSSQHLRTPITSLQPEVLFNSSTAPGAHSAEQAETPQGRARHAAYEAIRLCLGFLNASSDAFPPLKSVVGGLSFFIKHQETWKANKADLQRVLARISRLVQISQNSQLADSTETIRRKELERKFVQIAQDLEELKKGNSVFKYFMANDEAGVLSGILEDINTSIIDYQLSLQQETFTQISSLINEADRALLDRLPRARDAGYQSDNGCFSGTRMDILNRLEGWVNYGRALGAPRVYWLNGHAGSGKSTIAHSFCQRLHANGQLGASFFCSRDFSERSNIKMIFPTLSFQLACRYPDFRTHLLQTLKSPGLMSESMTIFTQLTELLVKPLLASDISTTISIDALDELKDSEPASTILSLLAQVIDQIPNVRFFVTGRPEAPIRAGFRVPALKPHTEIIILHEVSQSDVERDITLYLYARLTDIVKHRSDFDVSQEWPPRDQVEILVKKSAKLFVYAATCVKILAAPPPFEPREILVELTQSSSTIIEGNSEIDDLYSVVLTRLFSPASKRIYPELRLILCTIVLCYNPLSLRSLSQLLCNTAIKSRLGGLHSVLLVPSNDLEAVRMHHKSFPDYLTNQERCSNQLFYLDPSIYHAEIAIACLKYMKKNLRQNICSLPRYASNNVMSLDHRRWCIGETLEYACRFWAQHICEAALTGEHISSLLPILCEFLQECQILWLEVLSLVDDVHSSVTSIPALKNWLSKIERNDQIDLALRWLEDGRLLVLENLECIRVSAWHLYHSVLLFAPKSSLLRIAHANDLKTEGVVLAGSEHWEGLGGLTIHTREYPEGMAFSHDGTMIAVHENRHIMIFSSKNGKQLHTLSGIEPINTIVKFVGNDSTIMVGRKSRVELWDLRTGCIIHNYRGFTDGDRQFIDMSWDGRYIVSGDVDGYCHIWESSSGVIVFTEQFDFGINFVSFSSSSNSVFICSRGIIRHLRFLEKDRNQVKCTYDFNHFVISDDRSLLAACSENPSHLALYHTQTGQAIWEHTFDDDKTHTVIAVNSKDHSLWISDGFSLGVVDFENPVFKTVQHYRTTNLRSTAITSNYRYMANQDSRTGRTIYIHAIRPLPLSEPSSSSVQGASDPIVGICATPDGTTVVTAHEHGFRVFDTKNPKRTLHLSYPPNDNGYGHVESISISPNKRLIALATMRMRVSTKAMIWVWEKDLNDQSSLRWAVKTVGVNVAKVHFIDDNRLLIKTVHRGQHRTHLGFSDWDSTPDEPHISASVSGNAGTQWLLHVPADARHRILEISLRETQLDGRSTHHLDIANYASWRGLPLTKHVWDCYVERQSRTDPCSWFTDRNDPTKRFLWYPPNSHHVCWNKIIFMGGHNGVFNAIDFTDVKEVNLEDVTDPWSEDVKEMGNNPRELQSLKEVCDRYRHLNRSLVSIQCDSSGDEMDKSWYDDSDSGEEEDSMDEDMDEENDDGEGSICRCDDCAKLGEISEDLDKDKRITDISMEDLSSSYNMS